MLGLSTTGTTNTNQLLVNIPDEWKGLELQITVLPVDNVINNNKAQTVNGFSNASGIGKSADAPAGIKEHEIVIATTNIATVPKGATGTVVYVYANGEAYEVEFIVDGLSVVETALKTQIEKK